MCLNQVCSLVMTQWQIQDFPEEGTPTPWGGGLRQHTILPNFSKICMKLKEFEPQWEGRGVRVPRAPLDPPPWLIQQMLMDLNVQFMTACCQASDQWYRDIYHNFSDTFNLMSKYLNIRYRKFRQVARIFSASASVSASARDRGRGSATSRHRALLYRCISQSFDLPPCHHISQSFDLPTATTSVSHLTCPLPLHYHIGQSFDLPPPPHQSIIWLAPCHQSGSHLTCPLPPHHYVPTTPCTSSSSSSSTNSSASTSSSSSTSASSSTRELEIIEKFLCPNHL